LSNNNNTLFFKNKGENDVLNDDLDPEKENKK